MKQIQVASACFVLFLCALFSQAQQTVATNTNVAVPPLVNFGGTLTDANGKPMTGIVAVTFSLYSEQTGGPALWMETQNVETDRTGHYTVLLGSTSSAGLPADIFVAGQAHWLAGQIEGQPEQPRVLLVSAPYALKAGDAETIGGLPPSAFVLASPPGSGGAFGSANNTPALGSMSSSASPATLPDVTTTGGTENAVPLFTTATNIQNSLITQTSKSAINIGGKLNLFATGTATSSAGKNSQPLSQVASAYNSSTEESVSQTFLWQAEPANNDTSSPGGTLNVLYGSGTSAPKETGLKISNDGQITFAQGQIFPGTSTGTITGVNTASGSGLSGGGTNGTLTLSLTNACGANQILQWSGTAWACSSAGTGTVTGVTAGSGLSGGGTGGSLTLNNTGVLGVTAGGGITLGGTSQNPTIGINTSVVPQLTANNTFTGTLTLNNIAMVTVANSSGALQVTNTGTTGGNPAIVGTTNSTGASGVKGVASATTGNTNGVYGISNSGGGYGVAGQGGTGVLGSSTICCSGTGAAFNGYTAPNGSGNTGTAGINATGGNGDPDNFSDGGQGIIATGGTGGNGENGDGFGSDGSGGWFTGGNFVGGGDGVDAFASNRSTYAGYFDGNLFVNGTLEKSGGSFKIDDPLDPANKYLYHSFVESPDMMNIYNGNVVLDGNGEAVVDFPEWFGALNRDFRYQLSCIGGFAPVYVVDEINDNHFKIAGGKPGLKVSWQVTGIRQDPWANAHRIPVEEEKEPRLRGFYIHPELYGAPEEKQIQWARHPRMMKKMQEIRQAQLQHGQAQR